MGNKQTRQELIQNENYIESVPQDVQCMVAERLTDYSDIMLIHELYPHLRPILYRCVKEIYVSEEEDVVWEAPLFFQWTGIERTNILVRVRSYEEMIQMASLPNLRTHRVILDFEIVTSELKIQMEAFHTHNLTDEHADYYRLVRLYGDYLTLHLRNAPYTEEVIIVPGDMYNKYNDLSIALQSSLSFSFVSDYGGYIYINYRHCTDNINITVSDLPINIESAYVFLLMHISGLLPLYNRRNFTINASLPVTFSPIPRFLTFNQIILINMLQDESLVNFRNMINIFPVTTFAMAIDSAFGDVAPRLHDPKITEFRLFKVNRSKLRKAFYPLEKAVDKWADIRFLDVLSKTPTFNNLTDLDFKSSLDFKREDYQLLINKIPNMHSYTFYRLDTDDILFFLRRNIRVNYVLEERLSAPKQRELSQLQEQYTRFHIVAPKYYLIPEF